MCRAIAFVRPRRSLKGRDELVMANLGPTGCRLQVLLPARGIELTRELPGGLDSLRASGAEEHPVQVTGCERGNLGRELDRARVGVRPVGVEGELAHLRERCLADLLAEAVADVDGEQPRQRVQVSLAVYILEVTAVAADDDRHLGVPIPAHTGEVHPEVSLGGLLQVEAGGQLAPFERRIWTQDVGEHGEHRDEEDRRADHVHLRRRADAGRPQTKSGNVTSLPARSW